jgi:hypothetical protein
MEFDSNEALVKDYANRRGIEVQQNLCRLLSTLYYVIWVRETIKDSPEDQHKIDLVVGLDQNKAGIIFPEVFVQAKASTTGASTFNRHIAQAIKKQGLEDSLTRENWMLENRMIVLVGDLHISRSRKSRWPVTDDQIIDSFENQLRKINDYEQSKITAVPV